MSNLSYLFPPEPDAKTRTGISAKARRRWSEESSLLPAAIFMERARHEKARADRSGQPLSLAIVSIDKEPEASPFEVFLLSKILRTLLRDTDLPGWYSRSSIGVLLLDTDADGAQTCLEKISTQTDGIPIRWEVFTYPDQAFEMILGKREPPNHPPMLHLVRTAYAPRYAQAVKRGIDILGSLFGLMALAPIFFATAIAIKIDSKGPALFRQVRLGKDGRSFSFYKFRSMRIDGTDDIHRKYVQELIRGQTDVNQGSGSQPMFKITHDPRVTSVGRFIRKTSIDELPQLFNVLRGDMSLVGPRPPIPYEVENYSAWHLRRILDVQPGLTGLWQVSGRSQTSFDEMVRLDLEYVQRWSLWLDMKILLRTIKVVFSCNGSV